MNADELRTRFYEFAGSERFRKFVLTLRARSPQAAKFDLKPRHERLTFWQEQLWQEFAVTVDGVTGDLIEIRAALLWCDVHRRYLEKGKAVPDARGVFDRDDNVVHQMFADLCDRCFPFGIGYWSLVCPDCVVACREWMQSAKPTHNS